MSCAWNKKLVAVVTVAIVAQVSCDCVGRRVRRQDSQADDSNVVHFSIECPTGAQAQASDLQPAVAAPPGIQDPEFIVGMAKEGIKLAEETPKTVLGLLDPLKKIKLPKIERKPLKDFFETKPDQISLEPMEAESKDSVLNGPQRAAEFISKLKDKKDFLKNALTKRVEDVMEKEQEVAESVNEPSLVPLIKHIDEKAQELKKDVMRKAAEVKQKILDDRKQKEVEKEMKDMVSDETEKTTAKKPLSLRNERLRNLFAKADEIPEPVKEEPEVSASEQRPSLLPLMKQIDERAALLKKDFLKKAADAKLAAARGFKPEFKETVDETARQVVNKVDNLAQAPLSLSEKLRKAIEGKFQGLPRPSSSRPPLMPRQIGAESRLMEQSLPAPRDAPRVVKLNHYELSKNGCDVCSCLLKNMPGSSSYDEDMSASSPRLSLLKRKPLKSPFLNALRARSNILHPNDDLSVMSDTSNPVFALPPPGMTADGMQQQDSEAPPTLDSIIEQEDDEAEDPADKIDRLDAGITNLMDFVKIVDQVDRYVSDKTRQVITTLSKMYQEDQAKER